MARCREQRATRSGLAMVWLDGPVETFDPMVRTLANEADLLDVSTLRIHHAGFKVY